MPATEDKALSGPRRTKIKLTVGRTEHLIEGNSNNWATGPLKLEKDKKGELQERCGNPTCYFQTLDGLANHLFELSLRKSDATSILELVEVAKSVRYELREHFQLRLIP